MKISYLSIILCLSLLISACVNPASKSNAEPKQGNGAKIVPTKTMDATELLNFAESYSNLPQEEQRLELGNTNQVLALNPNDLLNRMKLVMMLGLPSSSFADTPKAQGLLQQLLQENILTNSQLAFAHVLFDYLIVVNKGGKSDQKHVEPCEFCFASCSTSLFDQWTYLNMKILDFILLTTVVANTLLNFIIITITLYN